MIILVKGEWLTDNNSAGHSFGSRQGPERDFRLFLGLMASDTKLVKYHVKFALTFSGFGYNINRERNVSLCVRFH